MSPQDLLRLCAQRLDAMESLPPVPKLPADIILHWPRGGHFPFAGAGTELLNERSDGSRTYAVPVTTILRRLAKIL